MRCTILNPCHTYMSTAIFFDAEYRKKKSFVYCRLCIYFVKRVHDSWNCFNYKSDFDRIITLYRRENIVIIKKRHIRVVVCMHRV